MALNRTRAAQNNNANEEREPTKVWLNIGVPSKDENGDPIFLSIPLGIALDSMKPAKITGKNEEFRNMMAAKNQLMEQLQKLGEEMAPGEELILDDLSVQIRRVEEPTEAEKDEDGNPHLSVLSQLSFARKAA